MVIASWGICIWFILAFGFVQAGKFGGFRSQSLIRFRHAAVLLGGLGKLPLGGTTQTVCFYMGLHCLMFHLFSLVGFAYVAGLLLLFKP